MKTTKHQSSRRTGAKTWSHSGLASLLLIAAACSSSKTAATTGESAGATPAPTTAAPTPTTTPAPNTAPDGTTAPVSNAVDTSAPPPALDDPSSVFPSLGPPTGKEIVVGLVNTEGTPGLDFPEIRLYIKATIDYLNQHGGMGGRPIKLETCTAKGSPDTSQACAQELAGKKVELVMIGLDLFPDYTTYTAANIPVIGVLPILPGDYTAKALFLTGGNATTTGAMTAVAKNHFKATKVGIVSADNPGANGTEASLTASLDLAGIEHFTIKGATEETDAGFQGLMRQAAQDEPDLLVSLYSDAGCIGTMRGRAALGITIPAITTAICSGKSVLDEVGDDAIGWSFVGVSTQQDTPQLAILQEILAPALGVEPKEVDSTALGLGALGVIEMMSLAQFSNMMIAQGTEVTGASLYEFLGTSKDLGQWPSGTPIDCGSAAKYPSICTFTFPVAQYLEGGKVETIAGLEAVSAKEFLP
jgi:ABC-type branched-subunit amino acid transport system substrate-binding protein